MEAVGGRTGRAPVGMMGLGWPSEDGLCFKEEKANPRMAPQQPRGFEGLKGRRCCPPPFTRTGYLEVWLLEMSCGRSAGEFFVIGDLRAVGVSVSLLCQ